MLVISDKVNKKICIKEIKIDFLYVINCENLSSWEKLTNMPSTIYIF